MTRNPGFNEFVDTAAANFMSRQLFYVSQDLPVDYLPLRFEPYLREHAIFDAAEDLGLTFNRISGIRIMANHAIRLVITDCETIEKQRIKLALRLNSPVH